MDISRYRQILVICLLSAVAFTACKPKQRIVYSTSPVVSKAHHELFSDIIASEFPYRTLSARLNMGMTSGTKSYSSRANLRIVKDEALQISIQPLFGVEMFRIYINPDTLFLLDRMNKRYVLESFSTLKELYPVGFDYYTMQSLFTNALFVSGKEKVDADDYTLFSYNRASDQNYHITAQDGNSGIDYSFTVNGDDRITFAHLMQSEKKHYMHWEYHNFMMLNNVPFPHKMNITLSSASRKTNAELIFSDVVTDTPLELELNVPSNYTKTSIDEVLKVLSPKK
ncbi:protein of unknown function [Porphyromonadaceae bacterium NLAE-zl-C104]|uniref:DUF4292 domain-containing protein n=1 Tax=Proteiniphilum saccharofermentans TaxID=1642647 RepID=UPI00089D09F8|nr:DUF4292 domain-containing protein [Proteiniphilum saccharofermentans]SDZ79911.1 protein of unknown function [Porphyromonadaceae bacterium KH3R12]SFT02684.1 protein of unknown function [Porphyromonadaceae bacterium NLAE-zl-C104]